MKVAIGVISTVAKEKYRQQLKAAKETYSMIHGRAGYKGV